MIAFDELSSINHELDMKKQLLKIKVICHLLINLKRITDRQTKIQR